MSSTKSTTEPSVSQQAVILGQDLPAPIHRSSSAVVLYSPELGNLILDLYVEGMSLSKICQMEGMPALGTLLRWLKDNTKFIDGLESARRARGILFEDRAMGVLEEGPETMAQVTWASKRFDAQMKLAEVSDPERYGKKVTVGGDSKRPIVFKVMTGVPAPRAPEVELNPDGTIKAPPLPVIEAIAEAVEGADSSEARAPEPSPPEDEGSIPSPPTYTVTVIENDAHGHPVHREAQLE